MADRAARLFVLLALTLVAVCISGTVQGQQQPGPTQERMQTPFAELATERGAAPADLAREVGIPADADLSRPVGDLMREYGFGPADLQAAMSRLSAGEESGAAPVPSVGATAAGDPAAMLQLPFRQFAEARGAAPELLAKALGLPEDANLDAPMQQVLDEYGLSRADVQSALADASPLSAEAQSKDWKRIRTKFALWTVAFLFAMVMLVAGRVTPRIRIPALAVAAAVFGLWLGVEPNAPGTVKDGLVLYGEHGAIFMPRTMALVAFLLMSIIGNKVFCGWGCQFGTLQDLVWHLPVRKYKPPFWLSNTIRVLFFVLVAGAAVVFGKDLMEPVDPFRVFRLGAPVAVGVAVVTLIAGLVVYRPWCSFFCPFGLVSWLAERISLFRPRVSHEICINCKACERACPTHSMRGLRAGKTFAQDCFACGACIRVCPVDAVRWNVTPPGREAPAATENRPGTGG